MGHSKNAANLDLEKIDLHNLQLKTVFLNHFLRCGILSWLPNSSVVMKYYCTVLFRVFGNSNSDQRPGSAVVLRPGSTTKGTVVLRLGSTTKARPGCFLPK